MLGKKSLELQIHSTSIKIIRFACQKCDGTKAYHSPSKNMWVIKHVLLTSLVRMIGTENCFENGFITKRQLLDTFYFIYPYFDF